MGTTAAEPRPRFGAADRQIVARRVRTGLYDDDTACDARDGWIEKLRLGTPPEIATTELIAEWEGAHDEPLFWLALADTQWKWGRLEPKVRERGQLWAYRTLDICAEAVAKEALNALGISKARGPNEP